jgi:cytochrome c553
MNKLPLPAGLVALLGWLALLAHAQPQTPTPTEQQFRTRVAPVLAQNCLQCHNPKKSRGSLDLSSRAAMLEGGEHGPVIVPGDARKSLLYHMIAGPKPRMPQQREPLAADAVADVARWIDAGAPWPRDVALGPQPSESADTWWSLRPLERPLPPNPADAEKWVRNAIDQFILATLQEKGLKPSDPADRLTLIRRVTFDLTGLPPTPEEIDAFMHDPAPDAYEKLVDRLLASPRYAERWARLWLDLVHYADTHGYDKDKRRLWAWLYRDWVIRAFNMDMPYRRFVRCQVAGDVLFPGDVDGIIATGFVVAGPWDFVGHVELREGTVDKEKTRTLDRDDMVASTVSTFCSLTAHCARCHDHKFDPIPQKDYYRLQAVFAGVERGDRPLPKGAKVYAVVQIPPRPIHLLKRGNVEQKGAPVTPGALSLLPGLDHHFGHLKPGDEGSRRAALAQWLTDDANVLAWRSIVNRVWQHHFGKALVDTPNDFGKNGSRPSHPALLDWLAYDFRDGGGSFKKLHKLILMSAAYRQASQHDANSARIDADNRYLWRMNRQRLDAEGVRDSVLAVSGKLALKMYGPGFELFRFKDDHSPVYDHLDPAKINDPATFRRTIYRFVVRSVPNPFLENLDCADPNLSVPVRNTTLTVLQALTLLNDPFMLKQAEYFAERLRTAHAAPERQVDAAYRLAFGRLPNAEERAALMAYVERHGLANGCRLLFNANEFLFVD